MNQAFSKIWIIIVLIILVAGGILAWQYWWVPKEEAKDETADWKTYRNEEYGFEMKYQENFHLYKDNYNSQEMSMLIFSDLSDEQQLITIWDSKVEERKKICKLDDFPLLTIRIVKESFSDWLKGSEEYYNQSEGKIFKEEIIIGNTDSYRVVSETKNGEKTFVLALPQKDNTILIDSFCPEECRFNWEGEKCKVFSQMLSTFRFLK